MSELIITSSAYIINGDSPMTSVANTVAMTTLAVHTLQPLIFYRGAQKWELKFSMSLARAVPGQSSVGSMGYIQTKITGE